MNNLNPSNKKSDKNNNDANNEIMEIFYYMAFRRKTNLFLEISYTLITRQIHHICNARMRVLIS